MLQVLSFGMTKATTLVAVLGIITLTLLVLLHRIIHVTVCDCAVNALGLTSTQCKPLASKLYGTRATGVHAWLLWLHVYTYSLRATYTFDVRHQLAALARDSCGWLRTSDENTSRYTRARVQLALGGHGAVIQYGDVDAIVTDVLVNTNQHEIQHAWIPCTDNVNASATMPTLSHETNTYRVLHAAALPTLAWHEANVMLCNCNTRLSSILMSVLLQLIIKHERQQCQTRQHTTVVVQDFDYVSMLAARRVIFAKFKQTSNSLLSLTCTTIRFNWILSQTHFKSNITAAESSAWHYYTMQHAPYGLVYVDTPDVYKYDTGGLLYNDAMLLVSERHVPRECILGNLHVTCLPGSDNARLNSRPDFNLANTRLVFWTDSAWQYTGHSYASRTSRQFRETCNDALRASSYVSVYVRASQYTFTSRVPPSRNVEATPHITLACSPMRLSEMYRLQQHRDVCTTSPHNGSKGNLNVLWASSVIAYCDGVHDVRAIILAATSERCKNEDGGLLHCDDDLVYSKQAAMDIVLQTLDVLYAMNVLMLTQRQSFAYTETWQAQRLFAYGHDNERLCVQQHRLAFQQANVHCVV